MRGSPPSLRQWRGSARFDFVLGAALVGFAGLEVLIYKAACGERRVGHRLWVCADG
jgi:hypothetical protein